MKKATRQDKRYEAVQELLSKANRNRCNEFSIVNENGYENILEKYDIQLTTLRRYLNEEGWKTKLVEFGDYQVLWIRSRSQPKWGEFWSDGKLIEVIA